MLRIDDVNYEVIRTSWECKRNWLKMSDERFSKGVLVGFGRVKCYMKFLSWLIGIQLFPRMYHCFINEKQYSFVKVFNVIGQFFWLLMYAV